jgi:cellulose synthase/poly-beta-1,6-N-acetylglucosamine synthase-like glycosyltransferase
MMILSPIALCFAAIYFGLILALRVGLNKQELCIERKLFRIAIIVAMKNEMQNARSCLEALINQTYPKDRMEIIIVDDGSTDDTPNILTEYQKKYSFIKIIRNKSTPPGLSSKKFALGKAIDNSTGEILLFTDADCVPSPDWAYAMTSCFSSDVGLVAGFSPLIDPTDSIMGKLLYLDSLVNGAVAAGSIGLGGVVTSTGRNIAYRREVYDQVNGFNKIMHSVSGDDDLFLQMVHKETSWKIKFATDKDVVVPSYQTKTLKKFFTQKKRHLSSGKYYNFKLKVAYFLFHLSNLFIFTFLVGSIILNQNIFLAILLFLTKLLMDWLFITASSETFNVRPEMRYFLFWEFFFVFYHLVIGPVSWFGKIRW